MHTNFFPVEIDADEFEIQRVNYSDEQLRELRANHNADASFFRVGDHIYISPSLESGLEIGRRVSIFSDNEPRVVSSLIRHLFFRKFRDLFPQLIPFSFSPLQFASAKEQLDPIQEFLDDDLATYIGYPRMVEVNFREVVHDEKTIHGLVFSFRNTWRCGFTIQQILRSGIDMTGFTVVESVPIPGLDGVLAPDERVVGEVVSTNGDSVTLRTNDGIKTRPSSELRLHRKQHQIAALIEHHLGASKARRVLNATRENTRNKADQNYLYGEIFSIASYFCSQTYRNADNFGFKITRDSIAGIASMKLEPTRLLFDYSPGATANRPLGGLKLHGAYDSTRFEKKNISVLLIFQNKNRGHATASMGRLRDGIPSSKYFQMGLLSLFRFDKIDFYPKAIDTCSPESYERAIDDAINNAKQPYDLAIVECPDSSRDFPEQDNPYLRAKLRLFQRSIPVQGIRESHLCAPSHSQAYTLGPMALQIYAKLGGIPWLLPSSKSVDHEIVIGIGNTVVRENQWRDVQQSRIVGMTTFFLGEGRYVLGKEIPAVPYEEYFDALLASLEDSITEVAAQYRWQENETIRLVFHIFKSLRNREVDVVSELVSRFPQFEIRFAFVTVSTEHPWYMFQKANYSSDSQKWNVDAAVRGDNLVLNDHSCLLQLKGLADRTNKHQPIPRPVLVRIHEKSTYLDLPFIVQQLLDFSFLSWKSFFPIDLPVSIDYSNQMAKLSSKLSVLPGWDPSITVQNLRKTKWFL
ncbi:MAG: Piwi domain-containing protein [Planctomycetota bacterium]